MKLFLLVSLLALPLLSSSIHAAQIHLSSARHLNFLGAKVIYTSSMINPFCRKYDDVVKYEKTTEDLTMTITPELDQKCKPDLKSGRLEFKQEKTGYYVNFKNSKKGADHIVIYCKSSTPSHFLIECSDTLPKKNEEVKVDISKDTILEVVFLE